MLNAVQGNLLVSHKGRTGAKDWAILIRGQSNIEEMFLTNNLTCMFQTLTVYLNEKFEVCFFLCCISTGSLAIVFFWGAIVLTPFFS